MPDDNLKRLRQPKNDDLRVLDKPKESKKSVDGLSSQTWEWTKNLTNTPPLALAMVLGWLFCTTIGIWNVMAFSQIIKASLFVGIFFALFYITMITLFIFSAAAVGKDKELIISPRYKRVIEVVLALLVIFISGTVLIGQVVAGTAGDGVILSILGIVIPALTYWFVNSAAGQAG